MGKAVKCTYKGKTYKSIKELWKACGDPSVAAYHMVYTRIHHGWPIHKALTVKGANRGTKVAHPITYDGVEYKSIHALYRHIRHQIRKVNHRRAGLTYETFAGYVHKGMLEEGIRKLHRERRDPDKGLKANSQRLEGADNLVCQRITKLGWSYERAVSTPRNTKWLPRPVKYKGKVYRSITACYNAVKPKMSVPKFTKLLMAKNCFIPQPTSP